MFFNRKPKLSEPVAKIIDLFEDSRAWVASDDKGDDDFVLEYNYRGVVIRIGEWSYMTTTYSITVNGDALPQLSAADAKAINQEVSRWKERDARPKIAAAKRETEAAAKRINDALDSAIYDAFG